jgi:hypothetical protein
LTGRARKPVLSAIAVLVLLLAVGAGIAQAGREQNGNIIASLSGTIAPHYLPRLEPAPARVSLSSDFYTDDGGPLPQLRRIVISMSSRGAMVTRGLPVCRSSSIQATSLAGALEACRPALVGHGKMKAEAVFPGQRPISVTGRILVFNGELESGRPVMMADVHMTAPPASFEMPFSIHRDPGASRVRLVAKLPAAAGTWAHISHFEMTLGRRYEYQGQDQSFLSAACFAPPGFAGTVFPLAQAKYTFAGGRSVTTEANSACRIKK